MDRKEFATFAAALKTYYPRETLLPNEQAMELWFRQLQDVSYDVAETALNKWVITNKWSPSIADIREMASSIVYGDIPDWSDAWKQVTVAINTHGYYRVKETLDMLDDLSKKCVERLGGVRKLCLSETPDIDRANFRNIYESLARSEQEFRMYPEKLKMLMKSKNLFLEGSEDNEV